MFLISASLYLFDGLSVTTLYSTGTFFSIYLSIGEFSLLKKKKYKSILSCFAGCQSLCFIFILFPGKSSALFQICISHSILCLGFHACVSTSLFDVPHLLPLPLAGSMEVQTSYHNLSLTLFLPSSVSSADFSKIQTNL